MPAGLPGRLCRPGAIERRATGAEPLATIFVAPTRSAPGGDPFVTDIACTTPGAVGYLPFCRNLGKPDPQGASSRPPGAGAHPRLRACSTALRIALENPASPTASGVTQKCPSGAPPSNDPA
jgi:hypothetical protein